MHAGEAAELVRYVAAARAGEQPAFAYLHRRFLPLVHGVMIAHVGPSQADDLCQECFIAAFGALSGLKDAAAFPAWLYRIAQRTATRARAQPWLPLDGTEPADAGQDPQRLTEAERVLAALHRLPEAYRETVALRLVEGLTGPEIAVLCGLTPDSVRVNLHRGVRRLRALLDITPEEDRHGQA